MDLDQTRGEYFFASEIIRLVARSARVAPGVHARGGRAWTPAATCSGVKICTIEVLTDGIFGRDSRQ
jgi:hypothetical protein